MKPDRTEKALTSVIGRDDCEVDRPEAAANAIVIMVSIHKKTRETGTADVLGNQMRGTKCPKPCIILMLTKNQKCLLRNQAGIVRRAGR